ncbi:MAG: 2'-5' RNA ligase family protein [Ilumatobacteraceae bacterium]
MNESTLLVEIEAAEPVVGHWRRRYDPVARQGIPAHITVLYPFAPPTSLGQREMAALAELAGRFGRQPCMLDAIAEFPGVLWLRPNPDEQFRRLTAALVAMFPEQQPYGGSHPDTVPHLTIGQFTAPDDQARVRTALEAELGGRLPLVGEATALSLYCSDRAGVWSLMNRFPFR